MTGKEELCELIGKFSSLGATFMTVGDLLSDPVRSTECKACGRSIGDLMVDISNLLAQEPDRIDVDPSAAAPVLMQSAELMGSALELWEQIRPELNGVIRQKQIDTLNRMLGGEA